MPKHHYMKLKLALVQARGRQIYLGFKCINVVVLVKGMFTRPFQTDFANFEHTSNTRKIWKKGKKARITPL